MGAVLLCNVFPDRNLCLRRIFRRDLLFSQGCDPRHTGFMLLYEASVAFSFGQKSTPNVMAKPAIDTVKLLLFWFQLHKLYNNMKDEMSMCL